MKIVILSRSHRAHVFGGAYRLAVEAVKVSIPGFGFINSAYASPYIGDDGRPTEKWEITDSLTGAALTLDPSETIDAAIVSLAARLRRMHMTERRLHAMRARALAGTKPKEKRQ